MPTARRRTRTTTVPGREAVHADANCCWLLTELDPDDPDIAFGLCDLGLGSPKLGSVRISELESIRGKLGMSVERELGFTADKRISKYAEIASALGYIKA